MITEPLSEEHFQRLAWPQREGFEDKRNLGTIGRLTKDNRVLWAGRYPAYHFGNDLRPQHRRSTRSFSELRAAWSQWFPMWEDVQFTHAYGGPVGLTARLEPYVGQQGGIFYGYGYSGHGVGPSPVVAKTLCDLVLKRDSPYLVLPFVNQREGRLPPEPIRFLGSRLTTELLARHDRRMDQGSLQDKPPLLLRLLRKLP
jgi:glycine/D-amino acid oxidase-like deaminating enzyme